MRNADYAPTDTPKSIRSINCLKSDRFCRSSGAGHARPYDDFIRLRHPALIKSQGSSSDSHNLCPSSPRGEAAFELSFRFSDNSAATLEAAL